VFLEGDETDSQYVVKVYVKDPGGDMKCWPSAVCFMMRFMMQYDVI